jgi:hypothetical protein
MPSEPREPSRFRSLRAPVNTGFMDNDWAVPHGDCGNDTSWARATDDVPIVATNSNNEHLYF